MEHAHFKSIYSENMHVRVRRSSGAIEDDWRILRIRPLTCLADDETVGYICVISADKQVTKWIYYTEFLELNAVPQDVSVAPIH